MYIIFNPHANWVKGCIALIKFVVATKELAPERSIQEIATLYGSKVWKDDKEFWHITANNRRYCVFLALM